MHARGLAARRDVGRHHAPLSRAACQSGVPGQGVLEQGVLEQGVNRGVSAQDW